MNRYGKSRWKRPGWIAIRYKDKDRKERPVHGGRKGASGFARQIPHHARYKTKAHKAGIIGSEIDSCNGFSVPAARSWFARQA
jgi:hypothetical protein